MSVLRHSTGKKTKKYYIAGYGENNPAKFISNYVITAMIGICIDWMDDGMKIPARDLAELCANVYINGSYKTKQLYASYE